MKKIALLGLVVACSTKPNVELTYPQAKIQEPEKKNCMNETRITMCLIEEARKECKVSTCLEEKLSSNYTGEEKYYYFKIKDGFEIFSIIIGDHEYANLIGVAAVTIDDKGVNFGFVNSHLVDYQMEKAQVIDDIKFRVNYDGSTDGLVWMIEPIVWNLSVSKNNEDTFVGFSTKYKINTRENEK